MKKLLQKSLNKNEKSGILSIAVLVFFLGFGAVYSGETDFPEGKAFSEVVSASCQSEPIMYNADGNYDGCPIACLDNNRYYVDYYRRLRLIGPCPPTVQFQIKTK